MNDVLHGKIYLIVSLWAYPFGGGEEFLYQTMTWAKRLGMECYWLAFENADRKIFESLTIEDHDNGTVIKVPGGYSELVLKNWIKLISPDIVHHQGHNRLSMYAQCEKLRIEFLSGFHFWLGAIVLNPKYLNSDILENYKHHKADNELAVLYAKKYCNLYTVTEFVSNCIQKVTGTKITDHIYASSSHKKNKILSLNPINNRFVTLVNIHKLKGGELFLWLLQNCPNIPFLGIRTEYKSEELDQEIMKEIKKRENGHGALSIIMDRVSDPTLIYKNTKILLAPNLVDETFCRVVNEGMMNGIPVISTGKGNIKYLMGKHGYIISYDDKENWKKTIETLYNNDNLLKLQSNTALQEYENFSESKAEKLFGNVVERVVMKSKERNMMIFTPWCDQGLGIQSRNYAHILQKNNYNVAIFAVKPYNANSCLEMQKNKEAWYMDNIYYSPNNREEVKDIEILNFIKKYNIGKCLLPETCWFRVFEVAKLLHNNSVKCYAIPNIEIVRKDEIFKHRYFHKILCNNMLCKNIFNKYGLLKTEYIGYGIDGINFQFKQISNEVKFLFIGGMNAFSRKHILDICEGFVMAAEKVENIKLTCTIQKTNLLEENDRNRINEYIDHPNINIIQDHLKYSDIINLYHTHDISIQVSKHEGLGLGFYEGCATGTPIITLDTPPHNEIIKDNVNGWIIPCYYKKMTDNTDPIFDSAYFNPAVLASKIIHIVKKNLHININKSLMIDYSNRLDIESFIRRFLDSIRS